MVLNLASLFLIKLELLWRVNCYLLLMKGLLIEECSSGDRCKEVEL